MYLSGPEKRVLLWLLKNSNFDPGASWPSKHIASGVGAKDGRIILPLLRTLNRAGLLICTQDERPPLGWGLTELGRREAERVRDA